MNDWWKAPILQGPENDYGEYDYMIEELPKDYAKWQFTPYTCHCDTCGKERHLTFHSEQYFYCWDGWDSMGYTDCWLCRLRDDIHSIKRKIKLKIKTFMIAFEFYRNNPKRTFKHYYELAKEIVR